MAGHLLFGRLGGRRRPLLAGFKLTHRCNLRCAVCPFWRQPPIDSDFVGVVSTLERLRRTGARLLIIEGGEPFVWREGPYDLEDVVVAARERFFCVGVVTNGTFPLQSSADILWVSVDGLRETHDRARGPVFDRVMTHIEASVHPNILANVTIHRSNWQEIPALIEFLAERVAGVTIQFYFPYEGTEDLSLSRGERVHVLDELIRLKRQGYPVVDSVAALEALKENTWRCHPWLLVNAEPDGSITQGCYLSQRAEIACDHCGFAAHTELSMAYDLVPGAIAAGRRVFGLSAQTG
jgi:MoaA/NifB/PqqE/SkfB family radical SAM enzyme